MQVDVIKKLRETIKATGSQWQVAEKLKISPAYLSDILNGRREPGKKILDALGVRRIVRYEKNGE